MAQPPPKRPPPSTGPKYKIAVIQLYPKPMNPRTNHERAVSYIRAAAQQGADLAVLPEYHLTNWLPHDPNFASLCANWRDYLEAYQSLARECNICIVPGTIVQTRDTRSDPDVDPQDTPGTPGTHGPHDSSAPPASRRASDHAPATNTGGPATHNPRYTPLENVAYFIGRDGRILGRYAKKNLWGPTERAHLTSSGRAAHAAFDTPLGRVGLLVCWDLAFPEAFRELVRDGARMVVVPTFWTLSDVSDAGLRHNASAEVLFMDSALTARAFENTAAVVFANAGGPPGRGYAGLSQVTVPFIGPLVRLGSCAEGMAVCDLDMQIVADAEETYQVRADLARDDWHYDYRDAGEEGEEGRERGRDSKL